MPNKHIEFSVEGQDCYLNTNQATQVSLIINELLLNAMEHGFRHTDVGRITVEVNPDGDRVRLVVSNTGDMLPEDFDVKKGQLGLQIIRSLSLGLGGEFTMEDRDGTTVAELLFKRATAE